MNPETHRYYYIQLPGSVSATEFGEFIEKKLSYCLKREMDNVILDLAKIEELDRMHVNILTRWVRNLSGLGGRLVLSGVAESHLVVLRTSKLNSMCETYPQLEDFQSANPDAEIERDEQASDALLPEKQVGEPETDVDGETGMDEEMESGAPESEGLEPSTPAATAAASRPLAGSITGSINIREVEKMKFDSDVSGQLPFLDNVQDEDEDAQVMDDVSQEPEELEELSEPEMGSLEQHEGIASDSAQETAPSAEPEETEDSELNKEVSDVRGTEAFYNVMGDSAEGDGTNLEDDLLASLDDVELDDDTFAEAEETEVSPSEETGEEHPTVDETPVEDGTVAPLDDGLTDSLDDLEELEEAEASQLQAEPETTEPEQAKTDAAEIEDAEPDSEPAPHEESLETEAFEEDVAPVSDEVAALGESLAAMYDSDDPDPTASEPVSGAEDQDPVTPPKEVPEEEQVPENADAPQEEVTEVRGTEAYYNLMGDSADGDGTDVDDGLLDDLDDVEVDETLFEEDSEEQEEHQETLEEEPAVPASPGPPVNLSKETLEGTTGQLVAMSGEYRCLGCGESDYFLKGYYFHSCGQTNCETKDKGWAEVLTLF